MLHLGIMQLYGLTGDSQGTVLEIKVVTRLGACGL
jgi:hypothetical protein